MRLTSDTHGIGISSTAYLARSQALFTGRSLVQTDARGLDDVVKPRLWDGCRDPL